MRQRGSLFLCVAVLALSVSACRRGRRLSGPPSLGNGARVELSSAAIKARVVVVEFVAFNETNEEMKINRNQIAVVGPSGKDYYRAGRGDLFNIAPHGKRTIGLEALVDAEEFKTAPGFFLRFDGLYVGTLRVDVPPMAVGQPLGGPGSTNPELVGPTAAPSQSQTLQQAVGSFRRMLGGGGDGAQAAQAQQPVHEMKTIQQYYGPRRQVRNKGTKCAAMPLKTKEIAEQMAFIMDELLLTELQQAGFEAIGPDDINALLGFEKTKQAVGCDEMSCVAEIGSALGVDYLAAGNVASLEGSVVLTLKLIDVRNSKVLARVNRVAEGGQKGLPRMIAEAVQELTERSAL